MTPRTVIISLPEETTVDEALKSHPKLPVSRIPIYKESIDQVTGFVLKTDLLIAAADDKRQAQPVAEMKRKVAAIHETAPLPALLDKLVKTRDHIALVIDEHGGTAGLVTMEDLIETLLGSEIVDEADSAIDMRKLARQKWEDRARRLGITTAQPKK